MRSFQRCLKYTYALTRVPVPSLPCRPLPSPLFRSFSSTPAVQNTKTTTNIAGLDVVPNARDVLIGLYKETIKSIEEYGANIPFNQYILGGTKYRLRIVSEEDNIQVIEDTIRCGQVEELIQAAEDQLDMLVYFNEEHPDLFKALPAEERAKLEAEYVPDFGENLQVKEWFKKGPTLEQEQDMWREIDAEIAADLKVENAARAQRGLQPIVLPGLAYLDKPKETPAAPAAPAK